MGGRSNRKRRRGWGWKKSPPIGPNNDHNFIGPQPQPMLQSDMEALVSSADPVSSARVSSLGTEPTLICDSPTPAKRAPKKKRRKHAAAASSSKSANGELKRAADSSTDDFAVEAAKKQKVCQTEKNNRTCDYNAASSSHSNMSSTIHQRREGTAGNQGHNYEIRLVAFIYYMLDHAENIEHFQLFSNMAGVGAFDDICIKVIGRESSVPLYLFIQCKHKEDSNKSPDINRKKYFESFKTIIEKFKSQNDPGAFFHVDVQDINCYCIIYSNGKAPHSFDGDAVEGDLAKLNQLIATSCDGKTTQCKHKADEVESLCKKHDYDKSQVTDFFNKLLLCSNQADQKKLEQILESKIRDDYPGIAEPSRVCKEFLSLIEEWWEQRKQPCLTKNSDMFKKARSNIKTKQLLTSINLTYMNKIQNFIQYTFREDVVSSWHLQDHFTTAIITENSVLTVVKLLQHLMNEDRAVLDLEYIVNLPTHDRNLLCAELTKTNELKALVFVCDKLPNNETELETLRKIGKAVVLKKYIIITPTLWETLKEYFPEAKTIKDQNNSLIDMSEESQTSILETTVMFQGTEVCLNLLLDDESKAYVNGDILNTIISKETIKISNLTVDRQYNERKHLYVDRSVGKTNCVGTPPTQFVFPTTNNSLPLKTLFDIDDDVVLVTGDPGMGKSTLLSHLSLKSKSERPHVWILRVKLIECSKQFHEWKTPNTIIDTLKFLCQVMLAEKLDGKRNNVEFELEEDNGVVYLTQCTGDQWTEFELRLFLHFYNKGGMIFIFDGFDESCPHYMQEVIQCLKTINSHKNKHTIWVTSRSYTKIIDCLQRTFGEQQYIIEELLPSAKKEYLMKIWQSNLKLEKLNEVQLQNVHDLLKFVIENKALYRFELPLRDIYIDAANYIINEIKTTSIPLLTFNDNYTECFNTMKKKFDNFFDFAYSQDENNNPLTLYMQADFVISCIKDDSHSSNKWNRDVNIDNFIREFFEKKVKEIRSRGKNNVDIYIPDIRIAYDKELPNLIAMHRKLAAYAIFNEDNNKLFSKKDLEEIKETIKSIEKGEEKTGLLDIVDGIPIFIHMTYGEYFSVEYICELLKHENKSNNILKLMDFIFNEMFSTADACGIIHIFDYKMIIDKELMSIMKNHGEEIFNLLIEHGKNRRSLWPPTQATEYKLHNFKSLFLEIFERYVNENNFKDFLNVVNDTGILNDAIKSHDELFVCIINKVKMFDVSILNDVICQNFGCLSRSWNYDSICSEDIAQLIRKNLQIWKAEQPVRLFGYSVDEMFPPGDTIQVPIDILCNRLWVCSGSGANSITG